jgi:hypothetical protein
MFLQIGHYRAALASLLRVHIDISGLLYHTTSETSFLPAIFSACCLFLAGNFIG